MNMLMTLAARYLVGRKLRTVLTTLAIVFGVAVILAVNSMLPTIVTTIEHTLMRAASQVDLAIVSETGEAFDAARVATVSDTPGVRVAAGVLRRTVTLPASARVTSLQLTGVDPVTTAETRDYPIARGRFLGTADAGQPVAVIDEVFAEQARVDLGSVLQVPAPRGALDLQIVGVLDAPLIPGQPTVIVPLDVAQHAFGVEGKVNLIEARVVAEADVKAVSQDVLARMGEGFRDGGLSGESDLLATMRTAEIGVNLFGVLALFMGAFLIFNTFRTSVAERQRDIGMLRAVGAGRGTVLMLILIESLLQGIIGTALGLVLGALFASGLLSTVGPILGTYFRMDIPGAPAYTAGSFIVAITLGIAVTVVAGLWPAVIASRLQPLAAIRPEPAVETTRARRRGALAGAAAIALAVVGLLSGNAAGLGLSVILFLTGLVLLTPALILPISRVYGRALALLFASESHLAEANLSRQPGRAAITASALMIGLAIIVAVGGISTSMRDGMLRFLTTSIPADYLLLPPTVSLWSADVGATPEIETRMAQVDGIDTVTGLRFALGVVTPPAGLATKGTTAGGALPVSMMGLDPVTYPRVAGLVFTQGDPAAAYAALAEGRTAIANSLAAAQLQLGIGDEIEIRSVTGKQTYRIVAIANDLLMLKFNTFYISHANLAADFGRSENMVVQARVQPGLTPERIAATTAALRAVLADYPQFTLWDAGAWRASQISTLDAAFSFLALLIVVLAIPSALGLINTLAINVIERTREIGMLRAIGTTRQQVQRMVLAESLLLTATGVAFGLLAGVWLGYVIIAAIRVALGWDMPYYFPIVGIVVGIATGLLVGVLAALLPARQAAGLEIVEALHYE